MQLPRKMSAQNMMASISRTLGTRSDSKSAAANEVKFAGEESKDKLYEPKHKQKLVRVLTVVAYVISVSLAAIILSLYYMFLWDPKDRSYEKGKSLINKLNATVPPIGSSNNNNKVECLNLNFTTVPSVLRQTGTTNNVTIEDYGTTDASTSQIPVVISELENKNYETILRKERDTTDLSLHDVENGDNDRADLTTISELKLYADKSSQVISKKLEKKSSL